MNPRLLALPARTALDEVVGEHLVLMRHYGHVQQSLGDVVRAQAAEIERLGAQAIRLQAAVVVRTTALIWAQEQLAGQRREFPGDRAKSDNLAGLEDSLVAADLVICQTGCLSHGAYWRIQDHCRRTGKTCVMVEEPDAVRIVRMHRPAPVSSDEAV